MSFDLIDRKFGRKPTNEPKEELHCFDCENDGWECFSTGRNDPHFRECPKCGNPKRNPSP